MANGFVGVALEAFITIQDIYPQGKMVNKNKSQKLKKVQAIFLFYFFVASYSHDKHFHAPGLLFTCFGACEEFIFLELMV